MLRSIVEERSFSQSLIRLGGAQRVDRVLTALYAGVAYRPEGYPKAGNSGLYIAKTDVFFDDIIGEFMPQYRLFFHIMSDTGCVHLIWLEEIPVEEEIPF